MILLFINRLSTSLKLKFSLIIINVSFLFFVFGIKKTRYKKDNVDKKNNVKL